METMKNEYPVAAMVLICLHPEPLSTLSGQSQRPEPERQPASCAGFG